MARTLIQKYASSMVEDFIGRANDLKDLKPEFIKGELKELFVARVLRSFLTSQFEIGSGIIMNLEGGQSCQTDVVIYDNRIIPPFIKEQSLGIYPAESVIATIEIKTTMSKGELTDAQNAAKTLWDVFETVPYGFKPLCTVFSFEGGFSELANEETGKEWLAENAKCLFNICVAKKYCWANVGTKGWFRTAHDSETYEEVKRFIALLLDNVRTKAQERIGYLAGEDHRDWFSTYIRERR